MMRKFQKELCTKHDVKLHFEDLVRTSQLDLLSKCMKSKTDGIEVRLSSPKKNAREDFRDEVLR